MFRAAFLLLLAVVQWQTAANDIPVSLPITANFNARSGGTVIPAQEFCVNIGSLAATNPLADIAAAGIKCGRWFVSQAQSCTTFNACTWSIPNAQLSLMQAAGFTKLIAVVYLTSSDLGTNPCNPPSSAANWATSIQSFLTFANTNYPGLVQEIELENEPDFGTVGGTTGNWCPAAGHTNLGDYLTLIHTAGPQIKAAFPSIKIAIPALAAPGSNASTWINATTGVLNPTTGWASPDFVSYHLYLGDTANWSLQWAQIQGASGIASFLTTLQADAGAIPVQITETNTGASFAASCCRNDPTFSPLYNSLLQIDYANAATVPQGVFYYGDQGGSTPGYFCLEGLLNANMDCTNTSFQRYPQWYSYDLFNANLNLAAGGNAATSVSPGSTTTGVSCTAFYTSSGGDVIACTNPTTVAYGQTTFSFTNAGTLTGNATAYILGNPTGSATTPTLYSTPASFRHTGTTYTVTVGLPAMSTVAIKIT